MGLKDQKWGFWGAEAPESIVDFRAETPQKWGFWGQNTKMCIFGDAEKHRNGPFLAPNLWLLVTQKAPKLGFLQCTESAKIVCCVKKPKLVLFWGPNVETNGGFGGAEIPQSCIWGRLGTSGDILVTLWGTLRAFKGILGAIWGQLETFWGTLWGH